MRILRHIYIILLSLTFFAARQANAQDPYENVVQINGVTMTADSLRAVPGVVIMVKGQFRGVESGNSGVFSIVAYKGDTLQFSSVGFRSKQYVIPSDIRGHYFSLIQLMVQDTFYLPETIIKPLLNRQQLDYAFKNWKIADDKLEIARKNTDAMTLRALAYTLPRDGKENQSAYQNMQAQQAVYYGQARPMQIFSPISWGEFYEAWKRGDYRRKK